jgi:hypothetical protein
VQGVPCGTAGKIGAILPLPAAPPLAVQGDPAGGARGGRIVKSAPISVLKPVDVALGNDIIAGIVSIKIL